MASFRKNGNGIFGVNAGEPVSPVLAMTCCLANPSPEHQALKMECSTKLQKAMSAHEKAISSLGINNDDESEPQDETPVNKIDTLNKK